MTTFSTQARARRLRATIWSIVFVAGTGPANVLAGNVEAGKTSTTLCVACHQADGTGMAVPNGEPWPALAGMDAGYLLKQLQDFKAGRRQNASMQPFSQMLNEQQMRDVAAYYASLPARKPAPAQVDTQLLAHGERLATQGDWDRYIVACAACHGPGNSGVGSDFPRLTGQLPEYLRAQLVAYRDGKRSNDPLDLMSTIAKRMTDRDIEAVAAWLGAQPALTSQ